jgi:hypothetical protein
MESGEGKVGRYSAGYSAGYMGRQKGKELIRERTVAGVRAARANGKTLGRPRRVFRRDEAIRLRAEGLSWRAIAKRLGLPVSTIVDACRCAEIVSPETPLPSGSPMGSDGRRRYAAIVRFAYAETDVLVQPEMERGRSPLVSIPPFGRGFSRHQGLPIR